MFFTPTEVSEYNIIPAFEIKSKQYTVSVLLIFEAGLMSLS